MIEFDLHEVATPCYVCDLGLLERNLKILDDVQKQAGCKILLALKGFAMWATFPLVERYLSGTAASSLHEAMLGRECFNGEVHVYSPAFSEKDITGLIDVADQITFNSFSQWQQYRPLIEASRRKISPGIRVNPEHSEVKWRLYDPCAPASRLGITRANFREDLLDGIEGFHFHTLCEHNADSLARTLEVVEARFGEFLGRMRWVNFGGGHHITRRDYDVQMLVGLVREFRSRWNVQVYLEPGEGVALNTGFLVASVLDIVENTIPIAILDTSASAHMPDVLEMPYRPQIVGAGDPGEYPHTYRLAGRTCLAGDVIGDYSFERELKAGDKVVFLDMAHYTMVKNTTFNGLPLPSIATISPGSKRPLIVRTFGYEDYRRRLS